ncbi:MAG: PilN domain-containing protein [Heyndrickxia faecalis]|jgi:Tfp pilus assembly protein PilN|uniref:PilN domain-containing protein n=1 Tax=Heyndrickxia TaxID=2837504 RepID=UPI0021B34E5B|nr:PilN domain-containing protein [Heyndrickxia coagulans]UXC21337.1 PilN domain-containing protein [Heyndrickxia coagulans]
MLVEINLLPKKEPKNIALLFWGGILAGAAAIFVIIFFIALHQTKQDLAAVNQQIKQTEALQAAEQAAQKSNADIQDFKKLSSAVKWASDTPVKTVPVLDKLTKLLPEYGYITDFSCSSTGANVTVQFDASDEAVYFLKRLNDSPYFSGAVLNSIKMNTETVSASPSDTSDAATGSSSGTGTSSTSAGSSSGFGSSKTASSTSSRSDASKTGGGSSSGTSKTGSSSTSAASKTSGGNGEGGSSSSPAPTGGTAGADTAATGEAEGVTVYEATYTIQLNQTALNAASKKEEQQ